MTSEMRVKDIRTINLVGSGLTVELPKITETAF